MGAPAIAYVAVLAAGLVPMVVFLLVLRMAKEPAPRRKQGRPVIGHPLEVSNDVEARAQVQSPSRYFDNRPATVFLDGDTDFDKAPSPMSPGAEDEQVESKTIGGGIKRGGDHRATRFLDAEDDDDDEPRLNRAESDDSMGWSSDEEDRARKDKFAKISINAKVEVDEEAAAEDLKNSFKTFSLLGGANIGGGPALGSRAARGSAAGDATAAPLGTLAGFGTAREPNATNTTRVVLPAPLPEPLVPPAAEELVTLKRDLREAGVKLWLPEFSDSGTGAVVDGSWAALVTAVVGRTGLEQSDADAGLKWLRIKSFNKRLAELNSRGYSDAAPAAPAPAPDLFGAADAVVDVVDPFGGAAAAAAGDPFGASPAAASPDPFGANTPQASDSAAPPIFDPFNGAAAPTSPAAAPTFDPFGAATPPATAPTTTAAFDPFGDGPPDADPFTAFADAVTAAEDDPFAAADEAAAAAPPNAADAVAAPSAADPFAAADATAGAAAAAADVADAVAAPPAADPFASDGTAVASPATDPFHSTSPATDPFHNTSVGADPFGAPMSPDFNAMATPDPFGAGSPDPADGTIAPAMSPDAEL